jgi:phasin family protein
MSNEESAMPSMPDFTKFFKDLKLPSLPDVDTLVNAQRRNIEAFTAANRVAMEGAQAIAKRHMEIVQQSMNELTSTMKSLAQEGSPQEKAAKQAELLKESYQRAVANMKELSDLIQQSNTEAMQLINKRFAEAMDEAKALMHKAAG